MSKQSKLNSLLENKHKGFLWAVLADKVWIMENDNFPTEQTLINLRKERIEILKEAMALCKEKSDDEVED